MSSATTRVSLDTAREIAEELAKTCIACKVSLPATAFWKDRNRSDGRYPACKACSNAAKRSAYAANPEPKRAKNRAWLQENAERFAAYNAQWHLEHRERRLADQAARRVAKRDEIFVYERAWRLANPDKARAKTRRYQKAHLDRGRERVARRKALIRSVTIEKVDYDAILARDGWVCHLCREKIDGREDLNFDHVVPLSRGGAHSMANISPSHALCNNRKGPRGVRR
jgi:5-methylcytosine-specific restriction endonuclease McrA